MSCCSRSSIPLAVVNDYTGSHASAGVARLCIPSATRSVGGRRVSCIYTSSTALAAILAAPAARHEPPLGLLSTAGSAGSLQVVSVRLQHVLLIGGGFSCSCDRVPLWGHRLVLPAFASRHGARLVEWVAAAIRRQPVVLHLRITISLTKMITAPAAFHESPSRLLRTTGSVGSMQ
jgi:hypothetical protein